MDMESDMCDGDMVMLNLRQPMNDYPPSSQVDFPPKGRLWLRG
jgi:hypothetical protein